MASKYIDLAALIHVIGNVYNNPLLLEQEDKYPLNEDDFYDDFHKIVFGVMYNLYQSGVRNFTLETISDFLETRPKQKKIYENNKGNEYLVKCGEKANRDTFDYYYWRIKKMTLLRAYDSIGMDITDLYNPDNAFDIKSREIQEAWLDSTSLSDIASLIDERIDKVREEFVNNNDLSQSFQAGDGIDALLHQLEVAPDFGLPLYGNYINTVTRGARLGKLYLRSAPTNLGKSRTMIADCCTIGATQIYDEKFGWTKNSHAVPCLFIATEQDRSEVQTMMLSFLSLVNEEHILQNKYSIEEKERVLYAAQVLKESPIYLEIIPDFGLEDIENLIKKHIREHNIYACCFDYLHTSLKILSEITKQAGKITLREDNVLFMLATRLKEICVKHNVFILTSTQLNATYLDSDTPDQNLLRGAKSIADKIDIGYLMLPVTEKDREMISDLVTRNSNWEIPTIKLAIYKNRRGSYKSIYLWCKNNLGTCRVDPMFATSYRYEFMSLENIKIEFQEENN